MIPPPLDVKSDRGNGLIQVNFEDTEKRTKHHIKDWSFVANEEEGSTVGSKNIGRKY